MPNITKKFTYDIADDYLMQTNNLKKTAEWEYKGPSKIWVFVIEETKKLFNTNYFVEEEDGENIPTPLGCIKVEVDANVNPLFCTLVGASVLVDGNTLPQHTETLPDGSVYQRPLHPMPDHTYDINEATYDVETNTWNYPWKRTWVNWENLLSARDNALRDIRLYDRLTDLPQGFKDKIEKYKNDLTNLEEIWDGYPAYKVRMPEKPF